jgi:hypothetical protein
MGDDNGDTRQDRSAAVMHDTVQSCGNHLRARRPRRARECGDEQESDNEKLPATRHTDLQLDVCLDDDGANACVQ